MKKQRNVGKRLSIFTIVLAFVAAFMLIFLFNLWLKNRNASENNGTQIASTDGIKTIDASELYYDNYWAKSIISSVADNDVPIPAGFEYLQGTKDTGVIVKDSTSGQLLLWIPYDSTVDENIDDYYKNCEYVPMDVDTQNSIALYGGFYVTLEKSSQYELLKRVGNDVYQSASKQAEEIYQDSETMNSHLINKTELAQVLAYSKKIGLNLAKTGNSKETYKIQLTAEQAPGEIARYVDDYSAGIVAGTPETYDSSNSDETRVIRLFNKDEIVVPGGFKEYVTGVINKGNGEDLINNISAGSKLALTIEDKNNPNLRYVFVPVEKEDLVKAFDKIKEVYTSQEVPFDIDKVTALENTGYLELLDSVATYNGFYIAEAELGYDSNGTPRNTARGMKVNEQNENKWSGAYDGDYYRGTEFKSYDWALDFASNLHAENDNVTSHLTYGIEWDATMAWLLNAETVTPQQLVKNSGDVPGAKYADTMNTNSSGDLLDEDLKGVHAIYGLAGNLFELTQETVQVDNGTYRSIRGGSYLYNSSDDGVAMASRIELPDNEIELGADIGFRNCLYLNPDVIENAKYFKVNTKGEISVKAEYKKNGEKENELISVTVPTRLDGTEVTSIAKEGFRNCTHLESVTLSGSVTNIKDGAFENCSSLTTVNMSENITGIATDAFKNCEKLESIYIPKSVETIYGKAFRNCTNLKELTIAGNNLKNINSEAFSKCSNLTTVTIESPLPKLEEIDQLAFKGCDDKKTLNVDEEMNQATLDLLKDRLEPVKTTNKMVAHSILENQIDGILWYGSGIYEYGAINEDVWNTKMETANQLTDYYDNNRFSGNKETMESELTKIRVTGEEKIETLLKDYREAEYKNGVKDYVATWHPELVDDEWVKQKDEEAYNTIMAENNMRNVTKAAIEFQEAIEEKVGNLNAKKQQVVEDIGNYVPYAGWSYSKYWETHMNKEIKDPAIAKVWQAKTEEEADEIKKQCETDIETYVTGVIKQKAQEEAEAKAQSTKSKEKSSKGGSGGGNSGKNYRKDYKNGASMAQMDMYNGSDANKPNSSSSEGYRNGYNYARGVAEAQKQSGSGTAV